MTDRLMGLENEYAFHAAGPRGGGVDQLQVLQELSALAAEKLPSLRSLNGNGIFLGNGGRLYLDTGAHLEWCTPEAANPWDVVRYLAAGEQILVDLAAQITQRRRLGAATFYKSNVDYSGTGATWGAHENYMHRADPARLPEDMIPFLVSRVIIAGAGGFDPTTPSGCSFTLSPRAYHITGSVTGNSTGCRGIYHTKDEPLCGGGYRRMHVLVGESLCSHTANWLKFATTALALALAEAGLHPGKGMTLRSPVGALRDFAADPTCTATAEACNGGCLSALDIQQHYLDLARRNAAKPFMPPWTPAAVEAWDAMLRRLRSAPDSVATCLDWAIKHQVYSQRVAKRGFTWKSLHDWGNLTGLLRMCAELSPGGLPKAGLSSEYVQNPASPLKQIVRELCPHLFARGMRWEQFPQFLALRLELFEIDTRFGQLGEGGVFNTLDRAHVLTHAFPGVDNIAHAVANPPTAGRAAVRGRAIQRLASQAQCSADWAGIFDAKRNQSLDLNNPWATTEKWTQQPLPSAAALF